MKSKMSLLGPVLLIRCVSALAVVVVISQRWCGTVNELLNAQFTVHDTKVTPLTKPIKVKKLNMNF